MSPPQSVFKRLEALQLRLDQVNRSWSVEDHEGLLQFFVRIFPDLMNAERCSIFYCKPGEDRIWLQYGTGLDAGTRIEAPREESIVGASISSGETVIHNDMTGRSGFHRVTDRQTDFETRSIICVPIKSLVGEGTLGAIQVLNCREPGGFDHADEVLLKEVMRYLAFGVEVSTLNFDILEISREVRNDMELFRQERFENVNFITKSQRMRDLLNLVHKVSTVPVNVFISGESGTGKEVIAQIIHRASDRKNGPFVAVNCSSIPEHLMESEFFGHEKGAFTGAYSSRIGRFEEANEGTLFLDEIADMPASIQPKFLRAIQEREGSRVGSNQVRSYDFRLISASYRNLREDVEAGRFREDLFFRLFSVEVAVPSLRERRDDIAPLSRHFLQEVSRRFNKQVRGFAPETLDLFEEYAWPGNVRQLQHEIERLVALAPEGGLLEPEHCSRRMLEQRKSPPSPELDTFSLAENRRRMETDLIIRALEKTGGNKMQAAALMGITRQSLHGKIRQYGVNDGKGDGKGDAKGGAGPRRAG